MVLDPSLAFVHNLRAPRASNRIRQGDSAKRSCLRCDLFPAYRLVLLSHETLLDAATPRLSMFSWG